MLFLSKGRFIVVVFGMILCGTVPPAAWAHHAGYTPTAPSEERVEDAGASGPMINSPTAATLDHGRMTLGFAFNALRYNSLPAGDAHELHEAGRDIHGKNHEETYNLHVGYGLTDKLDLYVIAPLVSKSSVQIENEDQLGRGERAEGFGDMRLLSKYRFRKEPFEAALIAGVKAPTGETSDRDQAGAKFEPEQQPGSGSWDGEFGVVASRSFKRHLSLASSVQYTFKGEGAQDRELGDVFRYNIGASYTLRPLGRQPNASLVLELNNEWALRDHSRSERHVLDSGGTTIFLTPGVTAQVSKGLSAFWAMPIPIYQDLGGEHEELKYELLTGLSLSF